MLELFERYREETKSNPILKHTFVGKDGKSVYDVSHSDIDAEELKGKL